MFVNYGLPIFDATVVVITINSAVQPVDHIKNVATITAADGFPNDVESTLRENSQPDMPIRVDC